LFKLADQAEQPHYRVDAIHDERGYDRVRRSLARQYDPGHRDPNLQVTGVDLKGNRRLVLTHSLNNGVPLTEQDAQAVLAYVADLWGYEVHLLGIDADGTERYRYEAAPPAGVPITRWLGRGRDSCALLRWPISAAVMRSRTARHD